MYILRRDDDSDTCTKGTVGCLPSFAITGSDPSEKEDDPSFGPSNYGKPGPHRFIGIGMVAGMIFLALTAFLIYGSWPKRMRRKICQRFRRRAGKEEEEGAAMKQVAVVLETTSSASSSTSEEKHRHHTQIYKQDDELMSESRKSTSRGRSRSRSKHRKSHRTSHRVVVGGPKEAEEVDGESGNVIPGWEVDRRRSVHYEVSCFISSHCCVLASTESTPQALTPNRNQKDPKLEVHIEKPTPAYQR